MRRRLLLLALLTTFGLADSANPLRGQQLIGLDILPGDTTVTVVAIDQATGAFTPLVRTPATFIANEAIAFDPSTRRLFFENGTLLYIANLRTGGISTAPIAQCCPMLRFDVTTHQLLGIGFLPGESNIAVMSINPVTGAVTPLVRTTATTLTIGTVAFDPTTRRVFFGSDGLYVADLELGSTSVVPVSPYCPPLAFDVTTHQLIGAALLPGEATVSVVSVDPATGALTTLLATNAIGVAGTNIAFDPSMRRLFFEDPVSLVISDLRQRVVSTAPLTNCCPVLEFDRGLPASVPAIGSTGLLVLAAALLMVGWKIARPLP